MKNILKSLKIDIYRLGFYFMLANILGSQFCLSPVSADPSLPDQHLHRQIEAITGRSDQLVHSFDLRGDGNQVVQISFADSLIGESYYLVESDGYIDAYNSKPPWLSTYTYFELCAWDGSRRGSFCQADNQLSPAKEYYDAYTGVIFRPVSANPIHLEHLFTFLKFLTSKGSKGLPRQ